MSAAGFVAGQVALYADGVSEHVLNIIEDALQETFGVGVDRHAGVDRHRWLANDPETPPPESHGSADVFLLVTDRPLDFTALRHNTALTANPHGRRPVVSTDGLKHCGRSDHALRVAAIHVVARQHVAGYCGEDHCAAADADSAAAFDSREEVLCGQCRRAVGPTWTPPAPVGELPWKQPVTIHRTRGVPSVAVTAAWEIIVDQFRVEPEVGETLSIPTDDYETAPRQYRMQSMLDTVPSGEGLQFLLTGAELFHGKRNDWVFGGAYGNTQSGTAVLSVAPLLPSGGEDDPSSAWESAGPDPQQFIERVRKQTFSMVGRAIGRVCAADDCVLQQSTDTQGVDRKPSEPCERCRRWWAHAHA